jgi:DNA-binding NarL/FixJ family response regulator
MKVTYQPTSTKSFILTKREKQVLELITKGFSSKQIAHQLFVSINTIHNHRKKMIAKANAGNIIEVVNIALYSSAS